MSLFRTKNADHMIRVGHSDTGLKKIFGPLDLILLDVGAIIGTGIFMLTGTGALTAGLALTLSFIVAVLACGFIAPYYTEFVSTISISGSIYIHAYTMMGELVIWVIDWDLMLEYGLTASTVPVGWSGHLQLLLSGFGLHPPVAFTVTPGTVPGMQTLFNLPTLVVMLLITTLLSLGIRESACVDNIMVAIKAAVMLLFTVVGARHMQPANWQPFMLFGMEGVFGAVAIVFFTFIGFDAATPVTEEIRNPKRGLPIGITDSLAVCTILYVMVATIMTGIVPFAKFAGVDHSVLLMLQVAGENWVAGFVNLGAITGMMTVIPMMTYDQARVIPTISRDGLLPKRLSHIYPRYSTPFLDTWVMGIVFVLIAAFVPLNMLAELINIDTFAAFSLITVAVLVLCRTRPDLHRGFRRPSVSVVPLLAIGLCLFLINQLQAVTWITFVVWVLIGLVVYSGYARHRSLLHGPELGSVPVSETVH